MAIQTLEEAVEIGAAARALVDAEEAKGNVVSATEAVSIVSARRERAAAAARPARDFALAARIQTALLERDRQVHRW